MPTGESGITHRAEYYRERMAALIRVLGYDEVLRRHYCEGGQHPDDLKYGLDQWNEVDDLPVKSP